MSNAYVQAIVSETSDKAILAPGTVGSLLKITTWETSGGFWAIVFQEETTGPSEWLTAQGENAADSFYLIFLEFQNPSLNLVYSLL